MLRARSRAVLFAVLLGCALPAPAADPILMFVLGMAREMATQAAPLAAPVEPLPDTYPGTTVSPPELRRLIDGSFAYLSAAQRDAVFDALNAELLKPSNAAVRASMIEYFAERALQVRAAQLRLAQLSYREKQVLAEAFGRELKRMPEDEAQELRKLAETGLLPVPADLNQLLLATFH